MNTGQQVVLALGLAVITIMGLYPPWLYTAEYQVKGDSFYAELPIGYHLIFSPPSLSKELVASSRLSARTRVALHQGGYPRLDYIRLLAQWLGVVLVTGGGIYAFRSYPEAYKWSILLVVYTAPVVCAFGLFLFLVYQEGEQRLPENSSSLPAPNDLLFNEKEVEIFDVAMKVNTKHPTISGRIRNHSVTKIITQVRLSISFFDKSQQIDSAEVTADIFVLPQEVRSFTASSLSEIRGKPGMEWSYKIEEVREMESSRKSLPPLSPESPRKPLPLLPLEDLVATQAYKGLSLEKQRWPFAATSQSMVSPILFCR